MNKELQKLIKEFQKNLDQEIFDMNWMPPHKVSGIPLRYICLDWAAKHVKEQQDRQKLSSLKRRILGLLC